MSANGEAGTARRSLELVWSGGARTKFVPPRMRRDAVLREPLVRRLRDLALEKRVTLVVAPAGSGKSTLLAQLAANRAPAEIAWVSLDEDDREANRFFASVATALRGVALEWETDPQVAISQMTGADEQSRAAVNHLINALCSYQGERLVLVLDDLHRLSDASALKLLDHFVERLPPEVGLLIGTRVEPALSLARWRSHGELGELTMSDLRFDERDAQLLARARLADAATPELVREVLKRTEGWVAGLQLSLGAAPLSTADGEIHRHTFDFLAHEVCADLPRELRDFAMRVSVLPELSPTLCAAVTTNPGARRLLEELNRRNLFVTLIDESEPILRFHELFQHFLQQELESSVPEQEVRELYARAAQVESEPTRAIALWLKARAWDEAAEAITRHAGTLIEAGGHAMVARWISQLPDACRDARPEILLLMSQCAAARYDFPTVRSLQESAVAIFRARGDEAGLARTLPALARTCASLSDFAACAGYVAECASLPLDDGGQATLSAMRAWRAMLQVRTDDVASALDEIVQAGRRSPAALYPAVADMVSTFFFHLPAALAPMRRLKTVCAHAERVHATHWQVGALAHGGWPEFMRGDYMAAVTALADHENFQRRFPAVMAYQLDMNHLRASHLAACGQGSDAIGLMERNLELFRSSAIPPLREAWLRMFYVDLACFAWCEESVPVLESCASVFEAPRAEAESPALETAMALTRGRLALLKGTLDLAERELTEACRRHDAYPFPAFLAQPRTSLAFLHLTRGNERAAWEIFAPVCQLAIDHDAAGMLLVEPATRLAQLLAVMPAERRQSAESQLLLARVASWRQSREAAPGRASVLGALSARELEVLARIAAGDSNKLIARAFDLSVHTVKRHVANILGKLDATTRSAAAALYRQSR